MTVFVFTAGNPWRKKDVGDPPDLDYSGMDTWVCPVRCVVNGVPRFVLDVVVDCIDYGPDDPATPGRAKAKALFVVDALNMALTDPLWRGNIRTLIYDE